MSRSKHKTHPNIQSNYPSYKQLLLLNVEDYETRIGFLENGKLQELIIERESDRGTVGNIYKGRIDRVVPGIGSAFVDIGSGKNAFLYVSDIYYDTKSYESLFEETDLDKDVVEPNIEMEESVKKEKFYREDMAIEDIVQKGQELLVQIVKEPLGRKGARATSHITLPGRFLVLMPTVKHIGISRKIQEPKERDRLRDLVKNMISGNMGVIVRTAAEGATEEELKRDCTFLTNLWDKIQHHADNMHAPNLVHQDLGLSFRVVRDMLTEDIEALIIDSRDIFERVKELVRNISPELVDRIHFHNEPISLFDAYDVESQIDKLLHRKVWLKSGGHIYIDEAEALIAIDVNTGKYSGGEDLEQTVLKTNLEAAKEVAHQIRARGLGGLLVIDFIDMRNKHNRHKVFKAFQEALKKDREKSNILDITEVGLIQMTRRRVRPSILKTLTQPCSYCDGDGVILSPDTMSTKVIRELNKLCKMTGKPKIVIKVHPNLNDFLNDNMGEELTKLSETYRKTISILPDDKLHFEKYTVELLDI